MRVRGLKLWLYLLMGPPSPSHPVRVRGLKLPSSNNRFATLLSHPVRVRGLKLCSFFLLLCATHVAPRAGAWVETRAGGAKCEDREVAPRAGAWVETARYLWQWKIPLSHPVRVRGLKQVMVGAVICQFAVAPRAGAWVET